MKVAVFSSKPYDVEYLNKANNNAYELTFFEARLTESTVLLAKDHDIVCCFVNDVVNATVLISLQEFGIKMIAMRCAGYNNVDVKIANKLGIDVCHVPRYSPYAVAEHAVGLILDLNRNIHRAHNRVREGDFSLQGLLGFDLHGKTVGVIGTGMIGEIFAKIMMGFGCKILAHAPERNQSLIDAGATYVELNQLFADSDIVTLHCPLLPQTHHIINASSIAQMKDGVMIINTSRGALIDTKAAIEGLKRGKIGYLGIDVYEEEADIFFEDFSDRVIQDDIFARLLTFPNVTVTGHQGFFTREALNNIAQTTIENIQNFSTDKDKVYLVKVS